MRINPEIVQQQITGLLLEFPELADDEILRADMIEAETLTMEFLSEIVHKIEDSTAISEGTAERIRELSERKSRIERHIEALRALCFKIMNTADIKKAELPCATLSIRNTPPKVVIHDEGSLPADCLRTTIAPDKAAIKEKFKAGETVPGAYMTNAEPSLSIRVK